MHEIIKHGALVFKLFDLVFHHEREEEYGNNPKCSLFCLCCMLQDKNKLEYVRDVLKYPATIISGMQSGGLAHNCCITDIEDHDGFYDGKVATYKYDEVQNEFQHRGGHNDIHKYTFFVKYI